MRLPNLTIAQQLAQVRGGFDLSRVGPGSVDALIKSDGSSADCFQGHCPGYISQTRGALGSIQSQTTDRDHCLRAVEKGDTFFYFELDRFDGRALQSFAAEQSFASIKGFAFADDGQGEMREWGEIAAGSD